MADADPDPKSWRNRVRDPKAWQDKSALSDLAGSAPIEGESVQLLVAVGERLQGLGGDAAKFLEQVQKKHPGDFWANYRLGNALVKQEPRDAVGYYRAALAVRPGAVVYNNLGVALKAAGQLDAAVESYLQAIQIDATYAPAYNNLGIAMKALGRIDAAIDYYEKALEIDPSMAHAHNNLGNAMNAKREPAKAIAHYEQAVLLNPEFVEPHYNLGLAMAKQGRLDDSIRHFQEAVRNDPKLAKAHAHLGDLLADAGKLNEAADHFQKLVELEPQNTQAHFALAFARQTMGRLEEAIDQYQQAIRIEPKLDKAYMGLGNSLLALGRFREAQAAFQTCLDLLPRGSQIRTAIEQEIRRFGKMMLLEARLPDLLLGKEKPVDSSEGILFAELCHIKKQYLAAAGLYKDVFAANPQFVENPAYRHRYNAARAAALVGCGTGQDKLSEEERARWRKQAREWLRAEIVAWAKYLEKAPTDERPQIRRFLAGWGATPEFAGLRDPAELEKLPPAERQECRELWSALDIRIGRAPK